MSAQPRNRSAHKSPSASKRPHVDSASASASAKHLSLPCDMPSDEATAAAASASAAASGSAHPAASVHKSHDDIALSLSATSSAVYGTGTGTAPGLCEEHVAAAVSPRRRFVSDSAALKLAGGQLASESKAQDERQPLTLLTQPASPIVAFALASSGRFAAFSSSKGLVSLWDTSKLLKVLCTELLIRIRNPDTSVAYRVPTHILSYIVVKGPFI